MRNLGRKVQLLELLRGKSYVGRSMRQVRSALNLLRSRIIDDMIMLGGRCTGRHGCSAIEDGKDPTKTKRNEDGTWGAKIYVFLPSRWFVRTYLSHAYARATPPHLMTTSSSQAWCFPDGDVAP